MQSNSQSPNSLADAPKNLEVLLAHVSPTSYRELCDVMMRTAGRLRASLQDDLRAWESRYEADKVAGRIPVDDPPGEAITDMRNWSAGIEAFENHVLTLRREYGEQQGTSTPGSRALARAMKSIPSSES
jgi:hypothetical protein